MRVSVTSSMFTEVFYKLSKCVCEFWTECSQHSLSLGCANGRTSELTHTQHMHGYIYPAHEVLIEGSDRWSEGSSIDHSSHERSAWTSKIILRGLMVEPWSNHIFRSPRRIRCILRGYPSIRTSFNCCPSQTGGWLTWSTYNTNQDIVYIRPNTDKVQTQVHQQNSPLAVALSLISNLCLVLSKKCRLVLNFDGLWSSSLQDSLMSYHVFNVGGVFKSSRLESRKVYQQTTRIM
ncbi:hypothetical protein HanPSC8_Chr04g0166141 [Helianthus annuus]|nr:hypothetical protein HanPSC8_Chr04g0166141 [Helianthus annuus]